MSEYRAIDITLENFLRPFFSDGETVCLRVFDDRKKNSTFKGAKLECALESLATKMDALKKHNAQNRGIYFVINYGGHEDADITRINAQFVECDELSIKEQLAQMEAFPIEPSVVVRTKKSLHIYWLMKDAKVEKFRLVQKRLIRQFHGDQVCINESRVFRLPGFYHCKGEPFMVQCIKYNPELRYTQAELETFLPEVSSASASVSKGGQRGLSLVLRRCLFMDHCRDNAAALGEHDWYGMITNLAVFDGGETEIHALSAAYPNYQEEETREKIRHFLSSGTKPITCATIAEKGFSCPRLDDSSCGCKSPAALSFKPPDVDTLRSCLAELKVKGDVAEDAQTAQDFVRDYLFNADTVMAAAFIEDDMKLQFSMKTNAIKRLIAMQREVYKSFQASGNCPKNSDTLPEWYEQKDRGGLRFLPGALAAYLAKEVHAFYTTEQYHIYKNGVYQATSDLEARGIVREYLISRYAVLNNISDAEGQWRMLILKPVEEINPDPYIINVKNGLYNVITDSFSEHTPDYPSTVQLNVRYVPGKSCPRFEQFLEESLHSEDITLVQEMLGYFLIPVSTAQKSFVIIGEAEAGKSKLLLTLNKILLGEKNVSNVPWQNLNDRFKTAELVGKLANIFADLPTKNIDDNGTFKAIVGEDYLTVERKNKDPFTFQPYARLLFSCNTIPRNYGDKSEGFYRRLIIIRFAKKVPVENRDPKLFEKFIAEADGIFMFAIEGLKRLIANEYQFSETVHTKAELLRYRIDSNSVLSFVEDCCEFDAEAEIERSALFSKYREYCHGSGLIPVSQKTFNRDIETAHPEIERSRDKVGSRRTWKRIRLSE